MLTSVPTPPRISKSSRGKLGDVGKGTNGAHIPEAFFHFNIRGRNRREEVMEKAAGFYSSFLQHISNSVNEAHGGYFQFNPCLPAVV